jgi:hypothetical protein
VELEHGHVEENGDKDQAYRSRDKMSHKKTWWDSKVTKEIPQLVQRTDTNSSNSEEADPLAAYDSPKGQPREREPRPPRRSKRFMLVFVAESAPEKYSESGKKNERRVEENIT